MNETFFFLIIGFLLIAILLFLFRETGIRSDQLQRSNKNALPLAEWPGETGELILGPADWDYVYENASPDVRRLFCAERRKLAVLWLREGRRKTRELFRLHRTHSSLSDGIHASVELKVLFDYFALRIGCEFAILMILTSSPAALRTAARWTSGMTNRLRSLAESGLRMNDLLNREKQSEIS